MVLTRQMVHPDVRNLKSLAWSVLLQLIGECKHVAEFEWLKDVQAAV